LVKTLGAFRSNYTEVRIRNSEDGRKQKNGQDLEIFILNSVSWILYTYAKIPDTFYFRRQ
jgi:hypothetical protein